VLAKHCDQVFIAVRYPLDVQENAVDPGVHDHSTEIDHVELGVVGRASMPSVSWHAHLRETGFGIHELELTNELANLILNVAELVRSDPIAGPGAVGFQPAHPGVNRPNTKLFELLREVKHLFIRAGFVSPLVAHPQRIGIDLGSRFSADQDDNHADQEHPTGNHVDHRPVLGQLYTGDFEPASRSDLAGRAARCDRLGDMLLPLTPALLSFACAASAGRFR
jgi:hypothetical protein